MWNLNGDDQVQADWRALASDLERRVDLLTGSLDEVRELVRRLVVEAAAPGSTESAPTVSATAVAVEEPPAVRAYREERPLPPVDAGWTRPISRVTENKMTVSAADAAWQTEGWGSGIPAPAAIESSTEVEEPVAAEPIVEAVAAPEDDEREQVRRAVEQLRAELSGSSLMDDLDVPPAHEVVLQTSEVSDMDAVRDEVRRAVEAARAEIDSVRSHSDAVAEEEAPKAFDAWQQAAAEAQIPIAELPSEKSPPVYERPGAKDIVAASIVIEDSEGRVELVRVYDALARIDCADQALLLNYTPHSITVGLGLLPLPDTQALKEAVSQVFERNCDVVVENGRAAVTLSGGHYRAA